jgi:hypothetical protein
VVVFHRTTVQPHMLVPWRVRMSTRPFSWNGRHRDRTSQLHNNLLWKSKYLTQLYPDSAPVVFRSASSQQQCHHDYQHFPSIFAHVPVTMTIPLGAHISDSFAMVITIGWTP